MQIKKLLGSTLALAMILPSASVNAELLKNFKLSGQLDLQGTAGQNVADFSTHNNVPGAKANNDRIGNMQTFLLVNADWDLLDDVHSKVTFSRNNRNWGTAGGNAHGNATSQTIDGAAGFLGTTFIDQAYVKIDKVFGAIDSAFGRQFFGEQGDVVAYFGPRIGILGMPVSALDTARFDWASDMVGVTGIVGKQAGSAIGVTGGGAPDVDLRALIATIKGGETFKGNAYVYDQVTHAAGASGVAGVGFGGASGLNNYLWLAGLRGKVTAGPAWVKAEYDKNFGQDRSGTVTKNGSTYTGWAFLLDFGANIPAGSATITPWWSGAYATGQGDTDSRHNNAFTPIFGDYRAGDIYTRFNTRSAVGLGSAIAAFGAVPNAGIANNGLSNAVNWGLGLKTTVNKATVGVQWWDYRTQTSATTTADNGTRPFSNNHHLGSEVDLDLAWKHSENVSFSAGAGRFFPGGVIAEANQSTRGTDASAKSGQGTNPASAEWFDVHIKF